MFLNTLYLHKIIRIKIKLIMKNIILLFFLTISIIDGFSQNDSYQQIKKSIFIYTIESINSQSQMDSLQLEVEKVKGISDVKIICKWETGKGQLIFTYTEFVSGTENIVNVDMSVIKQLILKNNLSFVDYKIK